MKKISDHDYEMLNTDARFELANEQTLLAWVRTSLTILAGGIAFMHFNERTTTVNVVGVLIIALGCLTALLALKRYKDSEKAIHSGQLPAVGKGPALQVSLVMVFALAIIIIEILQNM